MTTDMNAAAAYGCPVHNFDFTQERPAFTHFQEYDALRERGPMFRSELGQGFWIVTRYEWIVEVIKDTSTFSSSSFDVFDPDPAMVMIPLGVDPPEHIHYRRILNNWFSKHRVQAYEPRMREMIRRHLDSFAREGRCEFMHDVAGEVSSEAFLDFLGIPIEEAPEFSGWVETFFEDRLSKQHGDRALEAVESINRYFVDVLADRRADPRSEKEDFFSWLLASTPFDRPITDAEALSICSLLTLAGLDATRASLGYLFHLLAERPDLRALIVEQPERTLAIIEESLRMQTVVIQDARKVTRDVDFHGFQLKAGDMVQLAVGAGNRDPRAFESPLEIDPERRGTMTLSFGAGPHKCLGAALARSTMVSIAQEFLARIPEFEVAEDASLTERGIQVCLTELPLRWEPGQVTA